MTETKKVRARAIIFVEDKIISMYREREDRAYYTFPGGGAEEGESEEACVKREVFEEFGLAVEPVKKVYSYENNLSVEHFYICKWISGEFASGKGEEYEENRDRGIYKPTQIKISDIPNLPLMPPEIAAALVQDYAKCGEALRDEVKTFFVEKI